MAFDDSLIDVFLEAYWKEIRLSHEYDIRGAVREGLKAVGIRWVEDTVKRETENLLHPLSEPKSSLEGKTL